MENEHPARGLLLSQNYGVLSTLSVEVEGYPFGSVTPYCLNRQGQPVILISGIAQHTKNIIADSKVSLTVLEFGKENVQTHGRLTYLANAKRLEADEPHSKERYFRYFPSSRKYDEVHDFSFYELELVRARYIGGFGNIHWLNQEELLLANPFQAEEENGILQHMNKDHQSAMRHMLSAKRNVDCGKELEIAMVGIDAEGFDLMAANEIYRFSFPRQINSVDQAREELVAMAKQSG